MCKQLDSTIPFQSKALGLRGYCCQRRYSTLIAGMQCCRHHLSLNGMCVCTWLFISELSRTSSYWKRNKSEFIEHYIKQHVSAFLQGWHLVILWPLWKKKEGLIHVYTCIAKVSYIFLSISLYTTFGKSKRQLLMCSCRTSRSYIRTTLVPTYEGLWSYRNTQGPS